MEKANHKVEASIAETGIESQLEDVHATSAQDVHRVLNDLWRSTLTIRALLHGMLGFPCFRDDRLDEEGSELEALIKLAQKQAGSVFDYIEAAEQIVSAAASSRA